MLVRQGDVLLERLEERPTFTEHARAQEDGVIARGEVTGHAHVLIGGTLRTGQGLMYADVGEDGAKVVHDEHADLELEEGVWLVRRQVEYVGPDETTAVYD